MHLPPGPRYPSPLQLAEWAMRPLPMLTRLAAEYGDVFTLNFGRMGKLTLVSSPMLIKQIFTAPTDVLEAGRGNTLLGPVLGPFSVLLLDGAGHLEQRRLLLGPLHGERMQTYCHVMRQLTDADIDAWPRGESFAIHDRMQTITLEVILRTVFGADDEEIAPLRRALLTMIGLLDSRLIFFPQLQWDLGEWSPWGRIAASVRAVDVEIFELLKRRRASHNETRTDILSLLLQARHEDGEPMNDRELRDELVTLLAAGHETTATTLAWAVERILLHPDAQEKIVAELEQVVGAGPVLPEHLAQLEYLEAVVKETLRQRPILPIVARMVSKPFTFGGFDAPIGTVVAPCIALVHQRSDIYPEPEKFLPERFLKAKADPYTFLPFGGGIRRCLGMAFSMYEMKVILATLFSRCRLELESNAPLSVVRKTITLAPFAGARVRLRARRVAARS